MSEQLPPPSQPGPPGPPVGPYGYAPVPAPMTSSKATTSLVLGLISLVFCGLLLGIPAMIIGRQAKREIRESRGQVGGDGLATAGFVTGLIGTVWSVLGLLLVVAVFVFGGMFASQLECTTSDDGTVACS